MAVDIERLSKQQVPHKTGALQTSGHFERLAFCKYRVYYNKAYAKYWEYNEPKPGFRTDANRRAFFYYLNAGLIKPKLGSGFGEGRKSHYLGDAGKAVTEQFQPRVVAILNGIKI